MKEAEAKIRLRAKADRDKKLAADAQRAAEELAARATKKAAEAKAAQREAEQARLRAQREAEREAERLQREEEHRLRAKKEEAEAAARQRERTAKAEAVRLAEKAQTMLQNAEQLKANSKEQKVQAERLRAKCEDRARLYAARAANFAKTRPRFLPRRNSTPRMTRRLTLCWRPLLRSKTWRRLVRPRPLKSVFARFLECWFDIWFSRFGSFRRRKSGSQGSRSRASSPEVPDLRCRGR